MVVLIFALIALALIVGAAAWATATGLRNGDRALDASMSMELRAAGQPGESRPVVLVEVRNPSGTPVICGMSASRARVPAWLRSGHVSAPRRTARRGLRADQYATVGVAAADGTTRFTVPVTSMGSRYRGAAVAGQAGGRLRVHRRTVDRRARLRQPVPARR